MYRLLDSEKHKLSGISTRLVVKKKTKAREKGKKEEKMKKKEIENMKNGKKGKQVRKE